MSSIQEVFLGHLTRVFLLQTGLSVNLEGLTHAKSMQQRRVFSGSTKLLYFLDINIQIKQVQV
jgi:hypothetical protein